jgi:uncharacterized protein
MFAVVTGASAGLGEAFATRLAVDGWDLLITARRGERLEALADNLTESHDRRVRVKAADLAVPGEVARMVRRGSGAIINVASLLAFSATLPPQPLPNRATYAAAKAYLVSFTQALAGELAESLPGLDHTGLLDRLGEPQRTVLLTAVTSKLAERYRHHG